MVNENTWFPRKHPIAFLQILRELTPVPLLLEKQLSECHHEEYSQRKKDDTKASMQQIYNAEKCQLLRKWKKVAIAVLELSVGCQRTIGEQPPAILRRLNWGKGLVENKKRHRGIMLSHCTLSRISNSFCNYGILRTSISCRNAFFSHRRCWLYRLESLRGNPQERLSRAVPGRLVNGQAGECGSLHK